MSTDQVSVRYDSREFSFQLLESCAVSAHLRASQTFYEQSFLKALEDLIEPGAMVLDIGAHIGNHTVFFAGVMGLQVMAFEPGPDTYERLVVNVALNGLQDRVRTFNMALSDVEGELTMSRASVSDAGTLAVIESAGDEGVVSVAARRLDSFLEEIDRPTFMKLDVEGHEPAVLRGASQLIRALSPDLTVEIQSVEKFSDVERELGEGYAPIDIFNPTPTVFFSKNERQSSVVRDHVVRYGLEAALAYQQRRNWYVAERDKAEKLADGLRLRSSQVETLREKLELSSDRLRRVSEAVSGSTVDTDPLVRDVARLRQDSAVLDILQREFPSDPQIRDSVRLLTEFVGGASTSEARVMVFDFSGNDEPTLPATLSLAFEQVDYVTYIGANPRAVASFKKGKRWFEHAPQGGFGSGNLGSAEVSALLNSDDLGSSSPDAAVLMSGGALPEIEASLRAYIETPYVVVAHTAEYSFARLPVLNGSSSIILTDPEAENEWRQSHILPSETGSNPPLLLAESIVEAVDLSARRNPAQLPPLDAESRVLLVSYYAPPATPVSVRRIDYWFRKLAALDPRAPASTSCRWLTATMADTGDPNIISIEDRGHQGISDHWYDVYRKAKEVGLDTQGISWCHYVEEHLDELGGPYSTVILSGNPFHYFALGPVFRKAWGSKVVLDFRDPFARNTRMRMTVPQREMAIRLEDEWVGSADAVVSVNQYCLDSIAPSVEVPRLIVANGFDDEQVAEVADVARETDPFWIAYSGTVFANLPLDDVVQSIPNRTFELHHFGRDYSDSQAVATHPGSVSHGLLRYTEMLAALKRSVAGIVMTTGEPSTQTTKLFDYIACDLDLIIITNGRPKTGNLHEVTRDLEGVFWVKNEPRALKRFFSSYEPTFTTRSERLNFSRAFQAEKLAGLIQEIEAL